MNIDAYTLRLTACAAIVAAVLATAGCTGDDPSPDGPAPSASSAAPAMTFEEAHDRLPMNGIESSPITWELAGAPDTEVVLAARRSLVYMYWQRSTAVWAPVIPFGRYVYTEDYYDKILAPFASATVEHPKAGPVWVKVMGVENGRANRATVTFCTDVGLWLNTDQNIKVREVRANLESYVLENVDSGDGERRWLTDGVIDNDTERSAKYGTQCTEWAQHQP